MKNVKVTEYGRIHYIAQCRKCDWECAINTDETPTEKDVRREAKKHVRLEGHEVTIESGSSTEYSL